MSVYMLELMDTVCIRYTYVRQNQSIQMSVVRSNDISIDRAAKRLGTTTTTTRRVYIIMAQQRRRSTNAHTLHA